MKKEIANLPLDNYLIKVHAGSLTLQGFDELREQAVLIADYVSHIEVTEENIKDSKKLVARIRKACNSLEDQRKAVRKKLLEPYEELVVKVRDINDIASEAEQLIRDQIKVLEEKEREDKESQLRNIFQKRLRPYSYSEFMKFEDFLEPRHLNKTQSIDKTESEMVVWLQQKQIDLELLRNQSESLNVPTEELFEHYLRTDNLTKTITDFQKRNERKKVIKERLKTQESDKVLLEVDKKDLDLIEKYLESMRFKYKVIEN